MELFCESYGPKRDSGDYVGEKLIFDDRDLIAQAQLALLEAGDLKLVGRAGTGKRIDCRVEIPMLGAKRCQQFFQFRLGHARSVPPWIQDRESPRRTFARDSPIRRS